MQLALSTLAPSDPQRAALEARERVLEQAHPDAGATPSGGNATRWVFRRGLLDELMIEPRLPARMAPASFQPLMVTRLRVNGVLTEGAIQALVAAAPWLPLRRLDAFGAPRGALLHPLFITRALASVRDLWLDRCALGDDGARQLAAAAGRVERLSLADSGIGTPGAVALATSPGLASLRALNLERNPVGPDGARALVEAGRIEHLQLSGCPLGAAGIDALCRAPGAARLKSLWLAGCGLDLDAVKQLANAEHLAQLERLDLRDNPLSEAALEVLIGSPRLRRPTAAGGGLTLAVDAPLLGLHLEEEVDGLGPIVVNSWWQGAPSAAARARFDLRVQRAQHGGDSLPPPPRFDELGEPR